MQVMVRPVSTMLRTTRITTAAALASSPDTAQNRLMAVPQCLITLPLPSLIQYA